MATGTVKWFNDDQGCGFITPDDPARSRSNLHNKDLPDMASSGKEEDHDGKAPREAGFPSVGWTSRPRRTRKQAFQTSPRPARGEHAGTQRLVSLPIGLEPIEPIPETSAAERVVADVEAIGAPAAVAERVRDSVPLWFHTFALAPGIYTPGIARDHGYRLAMLGADRFARRRA